MELWTLDNQFFKKDLIDVFESAIWVERYRGDGDFEINLEDSDDILAKLPKEQMMWCEGSKEPMILEERDIKDGILKVNGITLTQWLNNRIIRTTDDFTVQDWQFTMAPAAAMAHIVASMCTGSDYLNGTIPTGIPPAVASTFVVPGLQAIATDLSGPPVDFSVPFGPVYDVLKEIATTYDKGMRIHLDGAFEDYFILQFVSYIGKDRTSAQSVNPVVQFSKEMDSFTDIHDLESIKDHKNQVFIFAANAPPDYLAGPGFSDTSGGGGGFHLRVQHSFADNLTTDGLSDAEILSFLNRQAQSELKAHKVVQLVDGQIIQVEGAKYGTDFFMGDLVEVIGNTGALQRARVTEYIRSHDAEGERAYPTLTFLE